MQVLLLLIFALSSTVAAQGSEAGYKASLQVLDEAVQAIKGQESSTTPEPEMPPEDHPLGPQYDNNVKESPMIIPPEDEPVNNIDIDVEAREIQPGKQLLVASLIILVILILMLGSVGIMCTCYVRRLKDDLLPKLLEEGALSGGSEKKNYSKGDSSVAK